MPSKPEVAPAAPVRVTLRVPHGELPCWLGEALLAIDAMPQVLLRLERPAAAPRQPLSMLDRWWVSRVPRLQAWHPDAAARARLAAWQSAAESARESARESTEPGTGPVAGAAAVEVAAAAAPPGGVVFVLGDVASPDASTFFVRDAAGRSIWRSFPLLEPITTGAGIRLAGWQAEAPGAPLVERRAVHMAATSRYSHALPGLAVALRRLVEHTLANAGPAGGGRDGGDGVGDGPADGREAAIDPAPATRPTAAAAAPPAALQPEASRRSALWHGLGGRLRAWVERQRSLWLSERWRIGVIDAPLAQLAVAGPLPPVRWITRDAAGGYWADPFGVPGEPRQLACEHFDERTGIGQIDVLRFDAADALVECTRLPVGGGRHVSFPHMFEIGGRRFGLPETVVSRDCVLHEIDADGAWRPIATLLHGVAAADPALFQFEGRFWLAYTDLAIGHQDNLCLQHATDLTGPWQAHAHNPVKVDIRGARMAGAVFRHGGALYRPAQDCLRTYGAAVVLHRIVRLSPDAFDEVTVRRFEPDARGPCPHGLHTLTAWGERTLLDGKRHGLNPLAFRRKVRQSWAVRSRRWRGAPVPAPAFAVADGPLSLPVSGAVAVAGLGVGVGVGVGMGSAAGAVAGSVDTAAPGAARRVFVYVPHLRIGGGEISMLRLAQGFAEAGLAVDLVVHTLHNRELSIPPGVHVLNLDSISTTAALRRLVAALREHRPQWLVSAFPHTNIAAVVATALAGSGTRCIVSEHAPLTRQIAQQGSLKYRLLPPLVRWAYRRADAVVAVSEGVRSDLRALVGVAVPIDVINNPVLPHGLADEIAAPPDHPWLLDPALEVVLSVCRLSVEKDLPTLLRAFAQVHARRPATRLLIAGEGPDRARLEALVAELGLADVVRLPGRTDQPLRWMARARVFVLASTFEGFGNVLIEALACGTPVVSTDCPVGPRELLEGGRFGGLVPVGDAAAMAAAIGATLAAPGLPAGAREAALRYTIGNAAAAYLRRFETLLPAGAVRPDPTC